MTRAKLAAGAVAVLLVVLAVAFVVSRRAPGPGVEPAPAASSYTGPAPGFLYGRVTTADGATLEGRLRFGGDEEAFWGDYFNGYKQENPWAAYAPPEALEERQPIEILGVELGSRTVDVELARPFMVHFGQIERIMASDRDLRVTLKSGTVVALDRWNADDFADGLRIWHQGGVVDLPEREIRTIELFPPPGSEGVDRPVPAAAAERLHGTVRTRHGDFSGFLQWDRSRYTGADELVSTTPEGGASRLRFDTVRSIERRPPDRLVATLRSGGEVVFPDTREAGPDNLGIYVHDPRYGRVLIDWGDVQRVDFTPADSGPAYGDFPPGRQLAGTVTTRAGRRLTGRLVYDLDESETTETLDAPSRNLDYTIPFGRIASIELPGEGAGAAGAGSATVSLDGGHELRLETAGDLGDGQTGLLVFTDGEEAPAWVPWDEVARIDFRHPATPAAETPSP